MVLDVGKVIAGGTKFAHLRRHTICSEDIMAGRSDKGDSLARVRHNARGPKEGPCVLRGRQAATLDKRGAGDGAPILGHDGWAFFSEGASRAKTRVR